MVQKLPRACRESFSVEETRVNERARGSTVYLGLETGTLFRWQLNPMGHSTKWLKKKADWNSQRRPKEGTLKLFRDFSKSNPNLLENCGWNAVGHAWDSRPLLHFFSSPLFTRNNLLGGCEINCSYRRRITSAISEGPLVWNRRRRNVHW